MNQMFPSFESYKEKVNSIISNAHMSNKEILDIMGDMVIETPPSLHEIQLRYIARCSPLGIDEICTNISRCSYPPDETKILLQRCNWIGQQVFYATVPCVTTHFKDDPVFSSLLETSFQKIQDDPAFNSQFIVVSYWHPIRPLYVWSLPFHPMSVEHNNVFKQIHKEFVENLRQLCPDENDFNETKKKYEYLSGLFCEKEARNDVYRFTSTYNSLARQYVFDVTQQIVLDGLIYPAAFSKGESMSIVLSKETVDQPALQCTYTRLYYLIRNPFDTNNIIFHLFADATHDENGNLSFKSVKY